MSRQACRMGVSVIGNISTLRSNDSEVKNFGGATFNAAYECFFVSEPWVLSSVEAKASGRLLGRKIVVNLCVCDVRSSVAHADKLAPLQRERMHDARFQRIVAVTDVL